MYIYIYICMNTCIYIYTRLWQQAAITLRPGQDEFSSAEQICTYICIYILRMYSQDRMGHRNTCYIVCVCAWKHIRLYNPSSYHGKQPYITKNVSVWQKWQIFSLPNLWLLRIRETRTLDMYGDTSYMFAFHFCKS